MKRRILSVIASALVIAAAPVQASVFFSEYVEGTGNNKAVEIFNTGAPIFDLFGEGFSVQTYANGSTNPTSTVILSGQIATGGTFVVAHSSADPALQALANQLSSTGVLFNGNDVVVLRNATTIFDVIGQFGVDPVTAWSSDGVDTLDNTLRRKATVLMGDADGHDVFLPSHEWTSHALNDFSNLGVHSIAAIPEPETYALMLAGLGLLGFAARRKKQS